MLRILLCSLSVAVLVAGPSAAQSVAPNVASSIDASEWGTLAEFVDQQWLQSAASGKPSQYVRFAWELENVILSFEGLDVDGNLIAGRFIRDPSSGRMSMDSVRNGQVASYEVELLPNGLVMRGSDSGAPVRQTYIKRRHLAYTIRFDELRNGKWVSVRSMDFGNVSDRMVKALGWLPRDLELERQAARDRALLTAAQPSFLDRLFTALGEVVIKGSEDRMYRWVSGTSTRVDNGIDDTSEAYDSKSGPTK